MENDLEHTTSEDPNRTRATLIQRVKDPRDESSWEDFAQIYSGYVYGIIRRMNISESDAEDLVQQLLLIMWNKLPKTDVEQIRSFRAWLSTITKNFVTDFIRKRVRETKRLKKAAQDTSMIYLKSIRLPEIDQIAEKEWKLHLTNLALGNIESLFSGHAIEVFRLSLAGQDIKQISNQLGLQENSVYRLRNRVKKRLVQEVRYLRQELE